MDYVSTIEELELAIEDRLTRLASDFAAQYNVETEDGMFHVSNDKGDTFTLKYGGVKPILHEMEAGEVRIEFPLEMRSSSFAFSEELKPIVEKAGFSMNAYQ